MYAMTRMLKEMEKLGQLVLKVEKGDIWNGLSWEAKTEACCQAYLKRWATISSKEHMLGC